MPPQDDYRPVFPEIADENYVVFADVLGFREIVRNNDHRGLYEIFDNDLRLAAEFGATGGVADPEFPGYADTDLAMVNMRIISDSVILWPSDTGSADFVWLLKAIQHLIKVSIERGIPVRAALTFGTLTHVRISYNSPRLGGDTLFGLALVDAYEEASNLQWAGGMLMDAAIVRYEATRSRKAPSIAALIKGGVLVPYDIPLRDGSTIQAHAVNWPSLLDAPLTADKLHWSFTAHGKRLDDASAQAKFQNTLLFIERLGMLHVGARQ